MKRTPSHVRKRLLFFMGLPLLLGSWAGLAFAELFILGIAWPAVRNECCGRNEPAMMTTLRACTTASFRSSGRSRSMRHWRKELQWVKGSGAEDARTQSAYPPILSVNADMPTRSPVPVETSDGADRVVASRGSRYGGDLSHFRNRMTVGWFWLAARSNDRRLTWEPGASV